MTTKQKKTEKPVTLLDQTVSAPEYENVYGDENPWVAWLRGKAPWLLKRPARRVLPKVFARDARGRFVPKKKPVKIYGEDE